MPMLGDGTTMTINDGASSAFVAMIDILEVTPPDPEVGGYDATVLVSPAGSMVKKPKSRAEPGTLTVKFWYSGVEFARYEALRGVEKQIKITYPDTKVTTIDGWIAKIEKGHVQNQDPVEMTMAWTCSKVPTTA